MTVEDFEKYKPKKNVLYEEERPSSSGNIIAEEKQ